MSGGDPDRARAQILQSRVLGFRRLLHFDHRELRLTIKLDGDSSAWPRRLIILNYEQKTHTKVSRIREETRRRNEGSGKLNWALEGLKPQTRTLTQARNWRSPTTREPR